MLPIHVFFMAIESVGNGVNSAVEGQMEMQIRRRPPGAQHSSANGKWYKGKSGKCACARISRIAQKIARIPL